MGEIKKIGKRPSETPAPSTKKSVKSKAPVSVTVTVDEGKPAKAPKAVKERKSEGPRGSRGMVGVTSGLPIAEFQNKLMERNFKAKLTDAELAAAMREEFPAAIPYTEKHVAGIRSGWNTGKRTGTVAEKPLPRYDEEGKLIVRGAGRVKAEKAPAEPKATSKVSTKAKKTTSA